MTRTFSFVILLSAFLSVYGGLHYYLYRKVKGADVLHGGSEWVFICLLAFLLLVPILERVVANSPVPVLSWLLAHVAYLWMGALFLFFSFHVVLDLYGGAVSFAARLVDPRFLVLHLPGRLSLAVCVALVAGVVAYGMYEAVSIRVEHVRLKTEKLPSSMERLRIVQVSDIHFSAINGEKRARNIASIVQGLAPDVLVSTGDLIDKGLVAKEGVEAVFRDLDVPFGKYAVTGNHEFIGGIEQAVSFTRGCGFTLLRNRCEDIQGLFCVAGVDDPMARMLTARPLPPEGQVLSGCPSGGLILLLKHQPVVDEKAKRIFDLQLSGHTHGGQIFPFGLVTSLFFRYHTGLHQLEHGNHIYVSRGTATWGPPVRFLSPPQITVVDFERKEGI